MLMKILIVLMVIIIGLVVAWQPHFINHFRPGFFFEKFKTQEEAKQALLKLHPLGSEVEPLLKTLERAGAKRIEWLRIDEKPGVIARNLVGYMYKHTTYHSLFNRRWFVDAYFDTTANLKLLSVRLEQGA